MLAMIVKPESKTEVDRYLIFEHFVQFKFQYTCWMLKAEGWTIEQYDWNTVILQFYMPISHSLEALSLKSGHIYWDVFVLWTFWQQTQTSHIKKYTHIDSSSLFPKSIHLFGGEIFGIKHAECLASTNDVQRYICLSINCEKSYILKCFTERLKLGFFSFSLLCTWGKFRY